MPRLLCLSALVLAAHGAHAGTILETVTRELAPDGETATAATYAQNGNLRVEGKAGDGVLIFRNDTIYIVNPRERTYVVMDRASMQRMAEQINPALKQMQEQLAQMPPEQRAQMEKMMGERMPGFGKDKTQEFRKTRRSDRIGGYPCTFVEVLENGALTDELCVAAPSSIRGAQELLDAATKMSVLLKDMLSTLDAPWLRQTMERQVANYEKLGGVPVLTRHYSDGKPVHETTIKAIRSETIAATSFEVPAGYEQKDVMGQR